MAQLAPSNRAIVRAAERICKRNGIEAEARDAWERTANEIADRAYAAGMKTRSEIIPVYDAARLAMLKSIIEHGDVQGAELDAMKAAEAIFETKPATEIKNERGRNRPGIERHQG